MRKTGKITISRVFFILLISSICFGCGSSEIKTDNSDGLNEIKPELSTLSPEIKEDIRLKSLQPKITATENLIISYSIQLGSFKNENYALRLSKKISASFGSVNYTEIDGLYKVRFGSFASIESAAEELSKIKNAGFTDSYIVKIQNNQ